jgi:hypothetical protein
MLVGKSRYLTFYAHPRGEVMESSFRAYRVPRLGRSRLQLPEIACICTYGGNWVVHERHSTGSPFVSRDKYFLVLTHAAAHVVAIVGLIKLSGQVAVHSRNAEHQGESSFWYSLIEVKFGS